MNPVKKIYCRIFQKAFHLVLPVLPYRQPKRLDRLSDIPMTVRLSSDLVVVPAFCAFS